MKYFKKGMFALLSVALVGVMAACSFNGAGGLLQPTSNESSSVAEVSSKDSTPKNSSSEDASLENSIESDFSKEESYEDSSLEMSDEISDSEASSNEDSLTEDSSSEDSLTEDSSIEQESSTSSSDSEVIIPPAPTPEYELFKPINDAESSTVLVKAKYKTEGAIVVDAVATDFGADPTGMKDSTSAIQSALNSVQSLGGGSVFLPIGKYLVSSTITIPSYVSLVGDWNKPNPENTEDNFDYGTVILARPQAILSPSPQAKPLFSLGESSGMVGMTFYYVEQNAENVKKYGYTVYANAPTTATLRNLTFLNSAYGIGVSLNKIQNELVNLENIYGTFLFNAIHHNATTDVGFYDNINISPKYWKNASNEYQCKQVSALDTFITNNLNAIILGDLDDQLISNVTIDGGNIGIKFTSGIREGAGFWGAVHNANISCQKGVYADYLNSVCGVVFTDSDVGVVENNSPVGCIKMSNSIYQAAGSGRVLKESCNLPQSKITSPIPMEFSSSQRLFIANNLTTGGIVDNSSSIQEILDLASNGGGVVVIPNGIYRVSRAIAVPENVEIRSTQAVFSRSGTKQSDNNGVIFISYVSGATFTLKANAGVAGIRIWHAKNDFLSAYEGLSSGVYSNDISIKAVGAGAYAYNNESVGAYVGYDFSSCDNHILKSNYGLSYVNFIKAGGKDGVIVQCLSNPNFMTRTNVYEHFVGASVNLDNWIKIRNSGESNEDFAVLRDDIGRTYTKMVRLENAENQVAFNVFCYGQSGLFDMVNTSATLVNTSLDYIPADKFVYELSGGSCDIIGSLRVYGTSIKVNSGKLTAYGRIAFGEVKEKAYDSSVSLVDEIEYVSSNAKRLSLFNCDSSNSSFNVTLNTWNSRYIYEGKGSWKWKTTTFEGSFTPVDISEYKHGYLHFYVYCSDISKMGAGQIEITSSGKCDVNEYNWNVTQYITQTGWNEVWLDLFTAGITGGAADLSNINYMRIYILEASATFYIDNIEVLTD